MILSKNSNGTITKLSSKLSCKQTSEHAGRPFQLECAIALKTGEDLICTAGCGAGKTLTMALPVMMLDEGKLALTIVPLKLLQQNHVSFLF